MTNITNENNIWFVYVHVVPKEISGFKNNKYYIGITSRPLNERWKHGNGYKQHKAFYPAIKKYGWENMKHIVLMENLPKEIAQEAEIALIAKYQTRNRAYGYNITAGGDGVKGLVPKNKGKKLNDRGRELCRIARLGKTMSESAKSKISASSKSRWQEGGDFYEMYRKTKTMPFKNKPTYYKGFENKTAKKVMCFETREIFGSASEASRLGYGSFSTICSICRGERKSLFKRHFMYVNDYLKEHDLEYADLLLEYKERRA